MAGEGTPFPVKIESNQTVGVLKEKIKEKEELELANVKTRELKLYYINILDDKHLVENTTRLNSTESPLVPLNATKRLSELYEATPPESTVHILVQVPSVGSTAVKRKGSSVSDEEAINLDKPSKRRHSYLSVPVEVIKARSSCPNLANVKASIDEYLKLLRPVISEFLKNPTLPNWAPPECVDDETRKFYNDLEIPLFNWRPNLLLHKLDNTPNPNVDDLFQMDMDEQILRVLCNTPGSGKTRLLFEGLCRHWGFYFVAALDADRVGSQDLETMIQRMSSDPGWVSDIFKGRDYIEVRRANTDNEHIAFNRVLKVLVARWTIFRFFIEVAKELNGGALPNDIRRHWLLFQILPSVRVGMMDPFSRLISFFLIGVTTNLLDQLKMGLAPAEILGPAFDPQLNHFFYVLDEARVAGERYMGAFADAYGKEPRPVLRPIIRCLASFPDPPIKIIVSGDGFSLEHFKKMLISRGGKDSSMWDVVHKTGDFMDKDTQLAYLSRYLPPSFLFSESGDILKFRMYKWLRGRYTFTARYLQILIGRPWKENHPGSPHKILNGYVYGLTGFTPLDGDSVVLEQEADVEPVNIGGFKWRKIQQGLLEELSHSIHTYMTRGQHPMGYSQWGSLVEYGLARFTEDDRVAIQEPLPLVSSIKYFESQYPALSRNIWQRMQDNKDMGFDELVPLLITEPA